MGDAPPTGASVGGGTGVLVGGGTGASVGGGTGSSFRVATGAPIGASVALTECSTAGGTTTGATPVIKGEIRAIIVSTIGASILIGAPVVGATMGVSVAVTTGEPDGGTTGEPAAVTTGASVG